MSAHGRSEALTPRSAKRAGFLVKVQTVLRRASTAARRVARSSVRIPVRIRDRLAWWFLATLALQIVVYALVLAFLAQRSLVSQVDQLLDTDARTIAAALDAVPGAAESPGVGLIEELGAGLHGSDVKAVLWSQPTGQPPRALSATPGAPPLPEPAAMKTRARSHVLARDGKSYYVRSIEIVGGEGGTRYLLQAARPAAPVLEPLSQLAWMLLLGFVAVMAFGWLGARAVAGAALAPIQNIVRATRAIGSSRLSKRLRENGPHDELRELMQVINELLQRFQDGQDRERRFAGDVAHELRTPLAAQVVIAQTALNHRGTSKRDHQAALQQMLDEARHMERFIDRLLTLTRIATQAPAAALQPIDVHDAARHTVSTLQLLSDEKHHKLTVDCEPGLQALGEATMLRQSLMNLVHNAIDHCPEGARIVVRAMQREGHVVVEVEDDGPGVPAPLRERLFKRLHRGHGPQGRRGLGFGLSIVRALMDAQGGSVHLDSKPAPGALFCLRLQAPPGNASPQRLLDAMESLPPPLDDDSDTPLDDDRPA